MFTNNGRGMNLATILTRLPLSRGLVWGFLIIAALLAFEIFNYSTTDFALNDLLGDLRFAGIRWATILAIAFCGIDFAGIARLFTPERGANEPAEVWYLFGAWLLAAAMNALLTWWGVSIAILQHSTLGNAVISQGILLKAVPIFVALMVWVIRVLIIGTFSVAGERLFSQAGAYEPRRVQPQAASNLRPLTRPASSFSRPAVTTAAYRPAPKAPTQSEPVSYGRPEPTYHSVNASPNDNHGQYPRR